MSRLTEILKKLNYAKTLHWERLCKEQNATCEEEQIRLAVEVLSWPLLDTGAASQSEWLKRRGAKTIKVDDYLKKP